MWQMLVLTDRPTCNIAKRTGSGKSINHNTHVEFWGPEGKGKSQRRVNKLWIYIYCPHIHTLTHTHTNIGEGTWRLCDKLFGWSGRIGCRRAFRLIVSILVFVSTYSMHVCLHALVTHCFVIQHPVQWYARSICTSPRQRDVKEFKTPSRATQMQIIVVELQLKSKLLNMCSVRKPHAAFSATMWRRLRTAVSPVEH